MRTWQTIMLWPDTHIPDHDRRAVKSLLAFVGERRPDALVHLGDLNNFSGPSRWSKGTADEYLSDVAEERDKTLAFLDDLRNAYEGPVYAHAGNHDERIADGIRLYNPSLGRLPELSWPELLRFRHYDITEAPRMFSVAPGWVTMHGHTKGSKSVAQDGGHAMKLAQRYRVSVACGHTHRLGVRNHTTGYGGRLKTLSGMECGHVSDIRKATYLDDVSADWQQGFGLLYTNGSVTVPVPVPIMPGGKFIVEGKAYGFN